MATHKLILFLKNIDSIHKFVQKFVDDVIGDANASSDCSKPRNVIRGNVTKTVITKISVNTYRDLGPPETNN